MKKHLGEVYWANSQRIDKSDNKKRRQYAVVHDNGKNVKVSKIRGFNENIKNRSRLYELDMKKYPLQKRSGVDSYVYTYGVDKRKLELEDNTVFDKNLAFKMTSKDTHNVIVHTKSKNNKKRK